MVRKTARDSLLARLHSASELETRAVEYGNSLGAMQFARQRESIEKELEAIALTPDRTASVALYFGGASVLGSIGIKAEFAGKALKEYQDLISTRHAVSEVGMLGARGRVPDRSSSDMMVTGIARGSFGFVLEEATMEEPTVRTSLMDTIDEVTQLVSQLASPDEGVFESALDEIDGRVLIAARDFFATLENARASVRIVEGNTDLSLGMREIGIAFARTSSLEVKERDTEIKEGKLNILPKSRRFEFVQLNSGEVISGTLSPDVASISEDDLLTNFDDPSGRYWRARFHVREVRRRNMSVKTYYTLVALVEEIDGGDDPNEKAVPAT